MMTKPIAMLVVPVVLLAGIFLLGDCPAEASEAPVAPIDTKWVHLELSTSCDLFALDPGSSAVLAVNEKGKATLYPRATIDGTSKKVVGPVGTVAKSTCVLFKQYKGKGYFIISAGNPQLIVLAADTLRLVAKITVRHPSNKVLAAGRDSNDPYVYCASGVYFVGCVSLETMDFVGELQVRSKDLAISADGNTMYSRPVSQIRSGFGAFKKAAPRPGGPPQWVQVFDDRRSVGRYVPGPLGRFCAVGMSVRTADLRKEVASLDFSPACFFRSVPVVVGLSGQKLVAASSNTFRTFATGKLPDVLFKKDAARARRQGKRYVPLPVVLMADDANKRVIAARGRHLLVRTLKGLNAPDESMLACDVQAPEALFVGRGAVIPVRPLDKRCTVKLGEAPEGMKLTAGQLVWTPTADQVGRSRAVLKLSGGGAEISQTVMLMVTYPRAVLPFKPAGISVSPDGTRAVVWSEWGRSLHSRSKGSSTIALVDLANVAVLVQKKVPYIVRTASIDAGFVYVVPTDSDRINVLDVKNLSQKNHVVTTSRVIGLAIVGSKQMVAFSPKTGSTVYNLPELKIAASPITGRWAGGSAAYVSMEDLAQRMRYRPGRRYVPGPMPLAIGKNLYAAGCLFDPALTTARTFVNVTGMTALDASRRESPILPLPWGRRILGSRLATQSDQSIVELDSGDTIVLAEVPVAATLATGATRRQGLSDRRSYSERWVKLILRQLVSGKVVRTVNLQLAGQLRRTMSGNSGASGLNVIVAHGRRIIAVDVDRAFVHDITAETLAKCPTPLGFVPPAGVLMLDLTKPMTVKLKTVGGTEPITFGSLGSRTEVKVDRKTGVVTIDSPALTKAAVTQVVSSLKKKARASTAEAVVQTPGQVLAASIAEGATLFKAYTGKSPKGLPVLVSIRVGATDKHHQAASVQFQAVIDLPAERLIEAIEVHLAKPDAKPDKERKPTEAEEAEAVRRLERRLDKLEAQIDLLTKLLMERTGDKKRPGTPDR